MPRRTLGTSLVGRWNSTHPDIHPHDANAGVEIGIARQPQSCNVEMGRDALIRDVEIDVAEVDDVSQVLSRSIESLFFHP